MKRRPKVYLTRKAISQRIGLTESSIETIQEISEVLSRFSSKDYSRALLIRRAIEVYDQYLLNQHRGGYLSAEPERIERLTGARGRPSKSDSKSISGRYS
ncbi:hypothetical protein [Amphritea balenae]|uniref:Uncharacterized protein n=1 Tax=Amphritea balenae TaxID=452629 RepID=A0A3P1SNH4_9GAMM|nr:hypothetical protein [Amphritea balenae]RRC98494.1 hypothetical protein EHS89_12795 [Amphritea balenae]